MKPTSRNRRRLCCYYPITFGYNKGTTKTISSINFDITQAYSTLAETDPAISGFELLTMPWFLAFPPDGAKSTRKAYFLPFLLSKAPNPASLWTGNRESCMSYREAGFYVDTYEYSKTLSNYFELCLAIMIYTPRKRVIIIHFKRSSIKPTI